MSDVAERMKQYTKESVDPVLSEGIIFYSVPSKTHAGIMEKYRTVKHIIEFNLPEDREEMREHMRAIEKNRAYRRCISEFTQWMRSEIKHAEHTQEEYDVFEIIRTKFWECMKDEELEGEDL